MRKERLLAETQRHKLLENSGINAFSNGNLISVDIQPEYQDSLGFDLSQYLEYINTNFKFMNSMTFLFNGYETLGMVRDIDYKIWLMENGLNREVLDRGRFYDKGYAFFRYCMDEGIDDEEIVGLVQYMIKNKINDSREIDEEMWNDFMATTGADQSEVRDLLEVADDMINIPDLMDYLNGYVGNIWLCGGGINECLKEVEIALMALDRPYNVLTKYTY